MKAAREERENGEKKFLKLVSVGGGGADSSAILKFEFNKQNALAYFSKHKDCTKVIL